VHDELEYPIALAATKAMGIQFWLTVFFPNTTSSLILLCSLQVSGIANYWHSDWLNQNQCGRSVAKV
jgi:hypothetical protein